MIITVILTLFRSLFFFFLVLTRLKKNLKKMETSWNTNHMKVQFQRKHTTDKFSFADMVFWWWTTFVSGTEQCGSEMLSHRFAVFIFIGSKNRCNRCNLRLPDSIFQCTKLQLKYEPDKVSCKRRLPGVTIPHMVEWHISHMAEWLAETKLCCILVKIYFSHGLDTK